MLYSGGAGVDAEDCPACVLTTLTYASNSQQTLRSVVLLALRLLLAREDPHFGTIDDASLMVAALLPDLPPLLPRVQKEHRFHTALDRSEMDNIELVTDAVRRSTRENDELAAQSIIQLG